MIAAVSGPRSSSPFPCLDDVGAAPFAGSLALVRKSTIKLCLLNGSAALVWRLYHYERGDTGTDEDAAGRPAMVRAAAGLVDQSARRAVPRLTAWKPPWLTRGQRRFASPS